MENNLEPKNLLRNNPFLVITLACLVAIVMSTISFLVYYNSDTRQVVQQIQKNNQNTEIDKSTVIDSGQLDATYIDSVKENIKNDVSKHDDDLEFSVSELTDSALGL